MVGKQMVTKLTVSRLWWPVWHMDRSQDLEFYGHLYFWKHSLGSQLTVREKCKTVHPNKCPEVGSGGGNREEAQSTAAIPKSDLLVLALRGLLSWEVSCWDIC